MERLREIEIYEAKEVIDKQSTEFDAQQLATTEFDVRHEYDRLITSNLPAVAIKNISAHIIPVVRDKCEYSFLSSIQHNQKILRNGKLTINTENNTIPICGFIFNIKGESIELPKYMFDKLSLRKRIITGIDGFIRLDKYYYRTYVARFLEKYSIRETSLNPTLKKRMFIKFRDETDALKKINYFTKLIIGIKNLYVVLGESAFTELQAQIFEHEKNQQIKRLTYPITEKTPLLELFEKLCGFSLVGRDEMFVNSIIYSGRMLGITTKMILKNELDESLFAPQSTYDPNKFVSKLEYAWKNNISWREFDMPYDELEKEMSDNVDILYGVAVNVASATRNNKCVHISLFSKVVRNRDEMAWNQLKEMAKLQDNNKFESVIYCDICGLYALCPHHYFMYENKYENDAVRINEIVRIFSSTEHSIDNRKFCRLCGECIEIMPNLSEEWETIVSVRERGEEKTELEKSIQFSLYQIFKSNLVIKGSDVNIDALSSSMTSKILTHIQEYDIKLNKSKIISNTDAKFSVRLVINIYAFAIIVHFVNISDGAIQLIGHTIKKNDTENMRLQDIFNNVFKLLNKQNEVSINRLKAFTKDKIKEILLKAYKQISGISISVKKDDDNKFDTIDFGFLDDYCYQFLHLGWNISNMKKNRKRIDVDDVATVLGIKSVDDLKFGDDIYANAKLAKSQPDDKYFWKIYEIIGKRIISHTMTMDNKNKTEIKNEFDELMKIREPPRPQLPQLPYFDTKNNELPSDLIMNIYGSDGHTHKWNKYLIKKDNILDKKNLASGKGEFSNFVCSICGDEKGSTKNDKIRDNLDKLTLINLFYKFYADRCPVPQIHDWENDECKKCGMKIKDKLAHDTKFYEKYATEFSKVMKSQIQDLRPKKSDFSKGERSRYLRRNKKLRTYDKWKYESKNINAMAELANINVNVINNIGLMYDEYFETISKNKANPHNTATPKQLILQCDRVINYINEVVIEYQNFRMCNKSVLPPDMAELCEKNIDTDLPAIMVDEFWDELEYRQHDEPLLYSNWCLNYLSQIIIEMKKPVAKKFASQFLAYIINSEKNMSKPDPSKFIGEIYAPSSDYFVHEDDDIDDADNLERAIFASPEQEIEDNDSIENIAGNYTIADLDIEDFAGSTGIDNADDI